GRVVWEVDGESIELSPGGLVLVPPGVLHRAYSRTQRVTLGSIHVDARLSGSRDVFELLVPPRHQRVAAGSRLDQYLRLAIGEFDRTDRSEAQLMLASWGRLVTLELLRDNADRGLLRHRPLDPLVAQVMEYLSERLAQPASLAELTTWAGYSSQHLNRLF